MLDSDLEPPKGNRGRMATVKSVFQAFKIHPNQAYALTTAGKLPDRPRGVMTAAFLRALSEWHEHARGQIPDAAAAIMDAVEAET